MNNSLGISGIEKKIVPTIIKTYLADFRVTFLTKPHYEEESSGLSTEGLVQF